LGFDNSFLLKAIQESPNTLRGVVVIDPKTTRSQLEELKEQGIQGVRLNLYGNSNPLGVIRNHLSLIELINESGMHLQLHHDDGLINTLLCEIPSGTEIVLDHFGRPKSESELLDAKGISRHIGKLWVKLSAQYRTPQIDHGRILQLWSNLIGAEAFVWGSDWPHTQFEATQSFLDQMNAINKLVSNEYLLNQILVTNPKKLYWS
jgi:predicted TIM-barrel fold metal-dependent hydrolase